MRSTLTNDAGVDYFPCLLTRITVAPFYQEPFPPDILIAVTLPDLLTDLTDADKPVTYSGLLQLNDLPVEGLAELRIAWPKLSTKRRREVVRKLVELADDNFELNFNSVFKSCLSDKDDVIRQMAAKGLWETEDRSMIRPLVKLLEDDQYPEVRAAAAMSLKNFSMLAQNGKLLAKDCDRVRNALLAAVNSPTEDFDVRRRALEAVASFNTAETNSAVREAYESDNPTLVQSAVYGMGQSSNPAWLPTVLDEMSNPLPAVRFEAATACGLLGDEGVVPRLVRLLRDDDSEVRLASIKALGIIGGPVAKNVVQQHLSDDDEAIEEAAREALISLEFDEDPLSYQFGA